MRTLAVWRSGQRLFDGRRAAQAEYWFGQEVRQGLLAQLETPTARGQMAALGQAVALGQKTPTMAAKEMLAALATPD